MDLSWDLATIGGRSRKTALGPASARSSVAPRRALPAPGRRRAALNKWEQREASFKRRRATLEVLALYDAQRPKLGTWLLERGVGKQWSVGCVACAAAGDQTPWAQFKVTCVKAHNVRRHANSVRHRRAAQTKLGLPPGSQPAANNPLCLSFGLGAPSMEDFQKVLGERRRGESYRQGSSVAGRAKALRMTWCLAEALRDRDRAALRQAKVITLHQDASTKDSMLCVRFSSVATNMEVRKGILGVARGYGTVAADVRDALMLIIKGACSPRVGCPQGGKLSVAAAPDQGLFSHVASHVEMFDADAAADEQRVGQLLRRDFPNLNVLLRDKTHAATRLGCWQVLRVQGWLVS